MVHIYLNNNARAVVDGGEDARCLCTAASAINGRFGGGGVYTLHARLYARV